MLRHSRSMGLPRLTAASRSLQNNRLNMLLCTPNRTYSSSPPYFQRRKKTVSSKERQLARELEQGRLEYARQVSQLRKEYASEVERQRKADQAKAEKERREFVRRTLERRRLKNQRSAQNAIRERQRQADRAAEFAEELRITQLERDAKKDRYNKARQRIVDELEAQAHLWLTTPEEVEAAFTHETEQLLWSRPNSVLGEANPSIDTPFWNYETHTWRMEATYPTPRELFLEAVLEECYVEANVDENFWTPERLAEREALERKAKLRAMVRDTGRRILLKKQKEILQDRFSNEDPTQIPNAMPVPSLGVLTNRKAMEEEGVAALLKDPTMFFEFESDQTTQRSTEKNVDEDGIYEGPTLGAPVALKNLAAYGPHEERPYPQPVGKLPKPDTRSQRQKKQAEREEKMLAAAQQEMTEEEKLQAQVDKMAEDEEEAQVDYANPPDYDSDDEEWEQGLDPELDADILATPRSQRFTEEDAAWIKEELEKKMGQEEELLRYEMATASPEMTSTETSDDAGSEPSKDKESRDNEELRELGVDVDQLNSVLESLTQEQMFAFLTNEKLQEHDQSDEALSDALRTVPGLTENQISKILELEKSLASNEKVRAAYARDEPSEDKD